MVVDLSKCEACGGAGRVEFDHGAVVECTGCVGELRRLRDIVQLFGFLPQDALDQSPLKRLIVAAL